MELNALLEKAARRGVSDIHLVNGEPPVFRVSGALERQTQYPALNPTWFATQILPALPEPARLALEEGAQSSVEAALSSADAATVFSLTVYRVQDSFAANLRPVPEIPLLELIGGDALDEFHKAAELPRGLVLFAGPTGSGKQTTASAVVDHINRTRAERIFILEDVLGYRWTNRQSIITTLRLGVDYERYERALPRGADPDVVYFTDLPNADALRQALTLADTGHLVLANVAAGSPASTIEQLVHTLPEPRDAGRDLLARTLAMVFCQRLLPRPDRPGRIPLYEFLHATPRVREAIRAGASAQDLEALAQTGSAGDGGSRTRNAALDRLLAQREIDEETAAAYRTA